MPNILNHKKNLSMIYSKIDKTERGGISMIAGRSNSVVEEGQNLLNSKSVMTALQTSNRFMGA